MGTKHTHAPWELCTLTESISGTGDNNYRLADIPDLNECKTGEYMANAKLMTAAPDLLEALEQIKMLNSAYWLNHSMNTVQKGEEVGALINQVTTIAEQAIKQASGQ